MEFDRQSPPQKLLIQGAKRLQPEEMMEALQLGANPFLPDENGVSGFSEFIAQSKVLRELNINDPSRHDPSSLISRMNSVFDKMLSQPLSEEGKASFTATLKDTLRDNSVQTQSFKFLQEKASYEGKTLSHQTSEYFKNKVEAGNALISSITTSQAFRSSVQGDNPSAALESLQEDPKVILSLIHI